MDIEKELRENPEAFKKIDYETYVNHAIVRNDSYIPFEYKWEKELMKLTKKQLIEQLKNNIKENMELKSGRFEQQVKPTLAELNRYTNRIVVVDHRQGSSDYGRTIDAYHVKLEFDWQDYGKTLKIFINDR